MLVTYVIIIVAIYEAEGDVVSETTSVLYPGQTMSLHFSSWEGGNDTVVVLSGNIWSCRQNMAAVFGPAFDVCIFARDAVHNAHVPR